jgi:hypothetical protein
MQELTFEQVEEVSGGIAFVGWVAYGAYQLGAYAVRSAIANPRAAATAAGLVAGWLSE